MKRFICFSTSLLLFQPLFGRALGYQEAIQQTAHIIYGDLKVQGKQDLNSPLSFTVILYNATGLVLDRQTIPNNGRFRFLRVPNGEYDLVVEAENREIAKEHFLLMEKVSTDIRKDLLIAWSSETSAGSESVASAYPRSRENADRMEKGLKAVAAKDYAGAAAALTGIVQSDPKDFEAWTELGTAQFMKGDKGQAEKSYKRALEEKPAYAVALLNLGRLQYAQKNYEAAIETLSAFVTVEAASAEGHRLLGEAYLQAKKGSKAVPELEKAISLDPVGQAEAHLRLAALYNAAGYKNVAAAEYEKFLAKRPDYPDRKKLEDYIKQNKP